MIATEPDDQAVAGAEFGEWRRVDPRTPVVYATPIVLIGAWYIASSFSLSGADQASVVGQALLPMLGIFTVVVRYLTGRYAIVDGALRWQVGLVVHKATDIGLDRIQDVEVTRPLLARMVGLAAVNVSSAGGAGEIKLQYLDHGVAERLGRHLQHLISLERSAAAAQGYTVAPTIGAGAPTGVGPGPVSATPPVELHRVEGNELAAWAAYRLWPAIPFAVAAVVGVFAIDWKVLLPLLPVLPFLLIAFAKPIFDRTNLTVSIDETSLFTSEGLTTVRRTSTQRERVQVVFAHQLWLQRLRGSETVRYASADVTHDRREGSVREELALNVPTDTWGNMAATIAHRQVIGPDWLRPKPRAAVTATRLRWTLSGAGLGLVIGLVVASVRDVAMDTKPPGAGSMILTIVAALIAVAVMGFGVGSFRGPRRAALEGWALSPQDLLVRHGVLRRTTLLLFAEKTQAIDVMSGPLQRVLGLVTVVVDIAPPGRGSRIVIRDISVADGDELRDALTVAGSIPLPNGV